MFLPSFSNTQLKVADYIKRCSKKADCEICLALELRHVAYSGNKAGSFGSGRLSSQIHYKQWNLDRNPGNPGALVNKSNEFWVEDQDNPSTPTHWIPFLTTMNGPLRCETSMIFQWSERSFSFLNNGRACICLPLMKNPKVGIFHDYSLLSDF